LKIAIVVCLALAGCASAPRDPQVLAYCSSAMLERSQVGLFDSRMPCLVMQRAPDAQRAAVLK
jgi:hypothetical protein